ncbi:MULTISPECIES: outer membrane beta-barrel protein [Marinobacter]|uniref:Outer membrane protein beta-barrel domain-containing protein n=1 Tax=Marinobacter profundi TaxID=2666256 RepID=A0A2G1UQJ1_9GAMM|nr:MULTISPECIES: outer membrane beta-barrel protein [Marinobacter]MBD3656862.1 outer membrane beta-barrel protein [Marinobacter sp.]PHQ16723.1 hypothetical protein CLH61_01725 [Marinobacter profundi]
MNQVLRTLLLPGLVSVITSTPVTAADDVPREELNYVGILATALEHRGVGTVTEEEVWSSAATLVVGGHITDLFHAELRAGGGYKDATVEGLALSVDYFASWYLGMHYPLTDYANVYGQFGFSYISGEAELANPDAAENRQFSYLEGDYPDSSFSVSWLAGMDVEILSNTYLVLEGGRLFKDTGSDVNTFQFSGGLRYEF